MYCQKCGKEVTGNFCQNCGSAVSSAASSSTFKQDRNSFAKHSATLDMDVTPKPIYKKWWFWCIIVFVLLILIIAFSGGNDSTNDDSMGISGEVTAQASDKTAEDKKAKITVADFSAMNKQEIEDWAAANNVKCEILEAYSDSVAVGGFIKQSKAANDTVRAGDTIRVTISKGKEPSIEYQNALKKAESYSQTMHMSKKAIYKQLTSEYGEQFPADAAQYAVDNLQADYKANALAKAKSYQQTMHMSSKAIYDQLVSEYGEQFTKEEAQYAIDHLND